MNCIVTYATEEYIGLLNTFIRSLRENSKYAEEICVLFFYKESPPEASRIDPSVLIEYISLPPFTPYGDLNSKCIIEFSKLLKSTEYEYYALCDADLYFSKPIDHLFSGKGIRYRPNNVPVDIKEHTAMNKAFFDNNEFTKISRWINGGYLSGDRASLLNLFDTFTNELNRRPDMYHDFCSDEYLYSTFLAPKYLFLDNEVYGTDCLWESNLPTWREDSYFYHVCRNFPFTFPHYKTGHVPNPIPTRGPPMTAPGET